MYVHGLDTLSCYLKQEAITRLVLKMIEEFETMRNIDDKMGSNVLQALLYFFACSETFDEKISKAINAVTNCKVLMQDTAETKDMLEAVITMLISKRGGYSSHEVYR